MSLQRRRLIAARISRSLRAVKHVVLPLVLSSLMAACATTEPRSSFRDDALEQEAQRYESIASSLEMKGPNPAAQGYRDKAMSVRADKRSQPTISDAAAKSIFDSLFDFLLSKGETAPRSQK